LYQLSRGFINILLTIFFVFTTALFTNRAYGHKVSIHAWVESDRILTESYFPDGKAVTNATVSVFDSNETLLLSGKTDHDGMFIFTITQTDDLNIVLDASAGHRASVSLSKEQLSRPSTATAHRGGSRLFDSTAVRVCIGIACIGSLAGIAMLVYRRKNNRLL
jgi:nickel transport protein